ncbi:MAG TPA: OmpA family protein [Bacteroidota bacterium]|jgi:outer membrane protein OmpA-like peptidoglycan-associated protein|nr:OmpA family protein [Bacteroidota bacterium]
MNNNKQLQKQAAPRAVFALSILVLLSVMFVPVDSGFAQKMEGRWVFGLHGGGNMWINDYNKMVFGPGGEIMLRYGITRAFSAGFLAGYEELKSKEEIPSTGQTIGYLKLHSIPAAATMWVHFASGAFVNPYAYAGLGAMIYKRLDGAGTYIPNSQFQTSILVPLGVGLEFFPSENASIVVDAGFRITDDYPDALKIGNLDGYATAKLGINFYLGSGDDKEQAQLLRDAEARRQRDLADAEARRLKQQADAEAEAKRQKDLADAEARRLKDLADAEARRLLAEQKGRDTVIVLEKGKTVVLKGVNFEFNKATLTPESEIILGRAHRALHASPELNVLIVGHTDNVGSAVYNKKLSLRRAETVKAWLVKRGISVRRLSVAGKGFDEPIDDNTTAEGQANNRRIEFHVLK